MSDFFHPKLQAVEALAPYRLRTTWATGEVLDVNIEAVLRDIPALTNLLDPQVFSKVRLAEWGHGIEWFDAVMWVSFRRCRQAPMNALFGDKAKRKSCQKSFIELHSKYEFRVG